MKKDVVILYDSFNRMSRAYNNEQRGSGKILSGGIDAEPWRKPQRFFGGIDPMDKEMLLERLQKFPK